MKLSVVVLAAVALSLALLTQPSLAADHTAEAGVDVAVAEPVGKCSAAKSCGACMQSTSDGAASGKACKWCPTKSLNPA